MCSRSTCPTPTDSHKHMHTKHTATRTRCILFLSPFAVSQFRLNHTWVNIRILRFLLLLLCAQALFVWISYSGSQHRSCILPIEDVSWRLYRSRTAIIEENIAVQLSESHKVCSLCQRAILVCLWFVLFCYKCTDTGIPPEKLNRLFGALFSAKSRSIERIQAYWPFWLNIK